MNLLSRIKNAYKKLEVLPDRLDCYQPLTVLFKAEYGCEPSAATLQIWMLDMIFGNHEKLNGFLVGFGSEIPMSPSNDRDFSEGFHTARTLVRDLAC